MYTNVGQFRTNITKKIISWPVELWFWRKFWIIYAVLLKLKGTAGILKIYNRIIFKNLSSAGQRARRESNKKFMLWFTNEYKGLFLIECIYKKKLELCRIIEWLQRPAQQKCFFYSPSDNIKFVDYTFLDKSLLGFPRLKTVFLLSFYRKKLSSLLFLFRLTSQTGHIIDSLGKYYCNSKYMYLIDSGRWAHISSNLHVSISIYQGIITSAIFWWKWYFSWILVELIQYFIHHCKIYIIGSINSHGKKLPPQDCDSLMILFFETIISYCFQPSIAIPNC